MGYDEPAIEDERAEYRAVKLRTKYWAKAADAAHEAFEAKADNLNESEARWVAAFREAAAHAV